MWVKLELSLVISECALEYVGLSARQKYQNDTSGRHANHPRFQNFAGGACPRNSLAMLHKKMFSKIQFCMRLWKKLELSLVNIRICSEILWIRRFYLLTKIPNRRIRCHQTVARFKFSRGNMPDPPPPCKASHLPRSPSHLPCSNIFAQI